MTTDARTPTSTRCPSTSRFGSAIVQLNNSADQINNPLNSQWTFPDIERLFTQIKKALPDKDAIKYSTSVNLIDWNKLKFDNFTGAECKEKLLEILESTRCFRTLTEVINDAENIFIFKEKGKIANEEIEQIQVINDINMDSEISNSSHQNENNEIQKRAHILALRNRDISMNKKIGPSRGKNTPRQNLSMQNTPKSALKRSNDSLVENNKEMTDVKNGAEVSGIDKVDNKFDVPLNQILKHTNWSNVVVNCGKKITKIPIPHKKSVVKKIKKSAKPAKRIYKRRVKSNLKRPINPFIQYFNEERKNLQRKYPGSTVNQLAKLAGQEYNRLPLSRKEGLKNKYYERKTIYEQKKHEIEMKGKEKSETEIEGVNDIKADSTEIAVNCTATSSEEMDQTANNPNVEESNILINPDIPVKIECVIETDVLANVRSEEIGKDYWGVIWYANENLCRLVHTKTEAKMDVIYNLWRSLEDDERESYTERALKLSYDCRLQMQQSVFSQVNDINT